MLIGSDIDFVIFFILQWNDLFCVGVEFDPTQPPRLNERVLKDKRKKLRETFDRVINMYVSMLVCRIFGSDFLLVIFFSLLCLLSLPCAMCIIS